MYRYLYQHTERYFGRLFEGAEPYGEQELRELGATNVQQIHLGMHFDATRQVLYDIVYRTRIFSRILAPLLRFPCRNEADVYNAARNFDWLDLFSLEHTFAIAANTGRSAIKNSKYAALKMKDGIVDRFRATCKHRPNVDVRNPDILLNLYVHKDEACISLDLGGGSLHRRGYRTKSVDAPMRETLAATILRIADWKGERPLYDPFCGSGTLLMEGYMRAAGIPAGYLRKHFGIFHLPDFCSELWHQTVEKTSLAISTPPPGLIAGSDLDPKAVSAARANADLLPGGNAIEIHRSDFASLNGFDDAVILANPPYGIRMGRRHEVARLLKEFGDFLKQRCSGSTAYVFFGERDLAKKLGLKPGRKYPLHAGGLKGVLCRYELY